MIFIIDGDNDYIRDDGEWYYSDNFADRVVSEHKVLVAIFEALRDGKTVSAVEN